MKRISSIILLTLALGLALPAGVDAQLLFEPNIVGADIDFGDVQVGQFGRRVITFIGNPRDDVLQDVAVRIEGNVFTANPVNFRIEAGQRVPVTFEFRPPQVNDYDNDVRITAGSPQGRVFEYQTTLRGVGVGRSAPEIEIVPVNIALEVLVEGGSDEVPMAVRNIGDSTLTYSISAPGVDWLTVAPRQGSVAPGRQADVIFRTTANLPNNGEYSTGLTLTSNDADERNTQLRVTLTVNIPRDRPQSIHFNQGWNLVSWNITPNADYCVDGVPAIRLIFGQHIGQIDLIKNLTGNFALPRLDFWGITDWDLTQGYWVRANEAFDLQIRGMPIAVDDPIPLRLGWNCIAYYPDRVVRVDTALAALAEAGILSIAKNWRGEFYVPRIWGEFQMRPGEGYMLKVTEAVEFRYPN
jgi:hypothetical protein